ncbi:MAG: CDP-diacylglycerol--glycerol-3-phosphate 3-phosphatidyltransferase [Treponema sp.]|jgi:CDP-diacylglycerol--glycerol-3-phosphate 3-phosphatidyltransferase|nr:CDP-diacylglycerol--glycerol-3-phosphate 3-phosphatidyltransferase [Treponema sp.]
MTLADKFTSIRLILAPVFFVIYLLHRFFPAIDRNSVWIVAVLWVLFLITEISDFFDGFFARKLGEVSDFGKLYDPFADTLTQVTFFFCFVIDKCFVEYFFIEEKLSVLPLILFLLILYREFGILFIRNLMLKKGTVLGARISGKIKTIAYILAIGCALLASSIQRLCPESGLFQLVSKIASCIFMVSAAISVYSFFDYVSIYKKK